MKTVGVNALTAKVLCRKHKAENIDPNRPIFDRFSFHQAFNAEKPPRLVERRKGYQGCWVIR